jgi:hypothetical protein
MLHHLHVGSCGALEDICQHESVVKLGSTTIMLRLVGEESSVTSEIYIRRPLCDIGGAASHYAGVLL